MLAACTVIGMGPGLGLAIARRFRSTGLTITLAGRERIAAFALQNKRPLVSGWSNYAFAGGLVTYGPNLFEAWRRAVIYMDRILKGAKPSDLPIDSRRSSNWWSIARPRQRSASTSRRRSSCEPTG